MILPDVAQQIVIDALTKAFELQGEAVTVVPSTEIYGPTSKLDSLGFIAFALNVEDAMRELGEDVRLELDDTFDPAIRYATVATVRDWLLGLPNPVTETADGYER
jgi:hypothetical protein